MRVRDEAAEYRAARLPWHDIQSSLVLHGPPGTRKTHFAAALARTLDAPLTATSVGSWFQNGTGDLGTTIKAASAAFQEARAAARAFGVAVLFIDEIDSLPNAHSSTSTAAHGGSRSSTMC